MRILLGFLASRHDAEPQNLMYRQSPVIIEPYNPLWPERFEMERRVLVLVLSPWLIGPIEHVGSTAVPGLEAKPVIDIMAAVRDLASSRSAIEVLQSLHYCYFDYRADVTHWFCKPSERERSHHLHLVPLGSQLWHERLAFRDRLRADPTVRDAYASLKIALASKYRQDREAYTEAKTDFIRSVLGRIGG